MRAEVTSKNLLGVTELTLIAKIKPGLVYGVPRPVTYATRLRTLLNLFYTLRKTADEREAIEYAGPVERLRMVHELRWTVVDNDTRLLLTVSFDQSWESYIRSLVDNVGPALDVILCHCEDYDGNSCLEGFVGFERFARAQQIPCDFFYSAEPRVTADDLRLLQRRNDLLNEPTEETDPQNLAQTLAGMHIGSRDTEGASTAESKLRLLSVLQRFSQAFPDVREPGRISPEDGVFYRRFARALLRDALPPSFLEQQASLPREGVLDFYRRLTEERAAELAGGDAKAAQPPRLSKADLEQIQGNILASYPNKTHGVQVFVEIHHPSGAQTLLKRLTEHLSTAADSSQAVTCNVALSAQGLRRLGLDPEWLAALPKEFRDGMEHRAGVIGDEGPDHPENWTLPRTNWPTGESGRTVRPRDVDLMFMLQTTAEEAGPDDHRFSERHPLHADVAKLLQGTEGPMGVGVLWVEPLLRARYKDHPVGHFGFVDGLSQPRVDPDATTDAVAPGEVLLLQHNERGEQLPSPVPEASRPVWSNGSFLVLRKLRQRVGTFERFVDENSTGLQPAEGQRCPAERIKGLLMGRYPDGEPLLHSDEPCATATDNSFNFARDPHGTYCPLHAHIRRANPRDIVPAETSERLTPWTRPEHPRIIRRGFSYGPAVAGAADDITDRGLMFMAFNARIAEQYEVVQRWLNGGNSTGVLSARRDLLTATRSSSDNTEQHSDYRVKNGDAWLQLKLPAKAMVSLQWGMYLFAPSKSALQLLACLPQPSPRPAPRRREDQLAADGETLIQTLLDIKDNAHALIEWQRLLEDSSHSTQAAAVWAAIRQRGGILRTPYGTLVGSNAGVRHVLTDETCFSVQTYWKRMEETLGGGYLGLDSCRAGTKDGRYEAEAPIPNALIRGISMEEAYHMATRAGAAVVQGLASTQAKLLSALSGQGEAQAAGNPAGGVELSLERLVYGVIDSLAKQLFALPDNLIQHFGLCSLYIFRPNPGPWVQAQAQAAGRHIKATYSATIGEQDYQTLPVFAQRLLDAYEGDRLATAHTLAGTVLGYVGPTAGSALSVAAQWVANGELWRLQRQLSERPQTFESTREVLLPEMLAAMSRRAVPNLLHRTTRTSCPISGPGLSIELDAKERVVISLQSAVEETPDDHFLLFGGNDANAIPVHACPGRNLALGTLLGTFAVLMSLPALRTTSESLVVRFAPESPGKALGSQG